MLDISCGSKRRLSDADKNERITLRQMVLNMSICKLQKQMGCKEPSLLRSVVINNTVKQIEFEMDSEMMTDYEDNQFSDFHPDNVDNLFSQKPGTPQVQQNFSVTTEESDEEGQVIISSLEVREEPKKENKFGAIGDHRKITSSSETPCSESASKPIAFLSGFTWDNLSLPSFNANTPMLETLQLENNFPDIDISLYDFDNSNFVLQTSQVQPQTSDWRVFSKSCAAEYDYRRPDTFFEELDQIMQVLVGM